MRVSREKCLILRKEVMKKSKKNLVDNEKHGFFSKISQKNKMATFTGKHS